MNHSRNTTALLLVLAAAASMVVLRALPYLLFEQLAFDSDQAIVGLMAKHLAERRAFPLFFYGQTYMLAVESWVAAPFFLVAGPGITTLRVSILAWNVAFVWLLVGALRRDCGLSPWWTLAPASVIALAPPSVATQLMSAQGGIVEPFVWVVALWLLRRRPLWFGLLLAIAFRNREFTMYAIPALLAIELAAGDLNRARIRQWLAAGVMFAVAWQVIEALKPVADLSGPGTRGRLLGGFSGSQIVNLVERSDFDPNAFAGRAMQLLPQIFRWFSGAQQIDSNLPTAAGPWIEWIAGALLIAATARLTALLLRRNDDEPGAALAARVRARARTAGFALYLIGVGAIAIAAFIASKPILFGYSRYALLGLVLPAGIVAAVVTLERSGRARGVIAASVAAWALLAATDHALVAARYTRHPDPNQPREVADRLIADGTTAAIGNYWRSYLVTFVARERVRVASSDFVRIQEYQDLFEQQSTNAVTLSDVPCPGGRQVADIYICRR